MRIPKATHGKYMYHALSYIPSVETLVQVQRKPFACNMYPPLGCCNQEFKMLAGWKIFS